MKIKILGTRGKIGTMASRHRRHSGILADDKILIDVGERSFLRHHPSQIFFTHLHSDHVSFLD